MGCCLERWQCRVSLSAQRMGRLVTTLFFESSSRSSFRLAANSTGEGEAAEVHR